MGAVASTAAAVAETVATPRAAASSDWMTVTPVVVVVVLVATVVVVAAASEVLAVVGVGAFSEADRKRDAVFLCNIVVALLRDTKLPRESIMIVERYQVSL